MPPAAERTAAGSSTSLPRDPPLRPFPDAVVFETGSRLPLPAILWSRFAFIGAGFADFTRNLRTFDR